MSEMTERLADIIAEGFYSGLDWHEIAEAAICAIQRGRMGLTKKQAVLVEFLESSMEYEGVTPSYQEMADALNLKSKSGVHRLIISLEERGIIRRLPHRARAIEVLLPPAEQALDEQHP